MTCPKHDELSVYVDNMMQPGERERFAAHLPNCPICRQRLDALVALRRSLHALPSPVLGFDLAARLADRLRATPVRPKPVRSFWTVWAPGGLSSAIALASGVWLGSLLVGGGIASAPLATTTMRVFDPVPPGGLCAAAELCRLSKGMQ